MLVQAHHNIDATASRLNQPPPRAETWRCGYSAAGWRRSVSNPTAAATIGPMRLHHLKVPVKVVAYSVVLTTASLPSTQADLGLSLDGSRRERSVTS